MERILNRRARLLSSLAAMLVLIASASSASAAWRAAGDVKSVSRQTDGAVLTLTSGARVAVTFVDLSTVRVRLAPRGSFEPDLSYAVEPKRREGMRAEVSESRDFVRVSVAGGAAVVIRRRPFLVNVLDADGRIVVEDDPARPASFDPETGAVETSKRRVEWEVYYGLGEKAAPTVSRDTQHFVMWNTDTYGYPRGLDPIYQSIGFYTALRHERAAGGGESGVSYGLFLDNTTRTYFDMGKTEPTRITFGAASGELNYYVFTGGRERSPRNVLRDYTDLTGRTPLPPVWALGNQQSRWSYTPESRVREVARGLREARIPADVIYLDIDYMDGYRVFTWDKTRFPDPAKMIADLRSQGFRVVLIIDPGVKVDPKYHAYKEGQAGGHFVKTSDGRELIARVWPGECAFPDFTDARAREWFSSYYRAHLDEGVAGFWNDMNEPGVFLDDKTPKPDVYHHPMKTFPLTARHAGDGLPGTHARYHNVYGMQMARSSFEGLRRLEPNTRPFVLTRAGYAGVQRFSAIWSGDNVASWDHLRLSIPMLLNLGASGVAMVGADVGGFSGKTTAELYARWLQAAALTPFLRSHSEHDSNAHEPYAFPPEFVAVNRASVELRYRLLPYIYTAYQEHTRTGAPVMRPLWFEYPADQRTYLIEDQFLVGRDLLVAPVVREEAVKRRVYFPKGDSWVDWWTGQTYEGGKEVEIDAPLNRLPLFARAGSVIPTQPVVQHTGEMSRAPLSLVAALGADGSGALYEDAGEGYEYRSGASRTTTATLSAGTLRVSRTGAYNVSRPLASVEYLGLSAQPREVKVSGRVVNNATYDAAARRLTVPLPAETVDEVSVTP